MQSIHQAIQDKKSGKITITTRKVEKEKPCIMISINDNGSGISSNDINKIFEPFFTTKKGEGMGLGLSISYSIIKSYNGEINVESKPGQGSAFRIYLPENVVKS